MLTALIAASSFGSGLGMYLAAIVAERYGRRGAMIIACACEAVGVVASAVAVYVNSVELMFVGRGAIMGTGLGISTITIILFMQECPPTAIRGMCASFQVSRCLRLLTRQELFLCVSGIVGAVLGMQFVLGQQLALMFLCGLPTVVLTLLLTVFVMHESPKYVVVCHTLVHLAGICSSPSATSRRPGRRFSSIMDLMWTWTKCSRRTMTRTILAVGRR